jgi:hypothetical protein
VKGGFFFFLKRKRKKKKETGNERINVCRELCGFSKVEKKKRNVAAE